MQIAKPTKKTYQEILSEVGDQDFFMTRANAQGVRKFIKINFPFTTNKKGKKLSGFPKYIFKKDRFLPAFCLQVDQKVHQQKRSVYYAIQCQKREEAAKQKKRILISKPVSKSCYCATCKCKYQDYLQHVESESHHLAVKNNNFTRYIQELCDFMNPEWQQQCNQAIEDQKIANSQKPKKKRKLNQTKQLNCFTDFNKENIKSGNKEIETLTQNKVLEQNVPA